MKCKHCDSEQTVKAGKNGSGSQRYRCKGCGRHFTPNPNAIVYPPAIRQEAVAMDVDGHGYRRTGRNVRVNHQSVATWVKAAAQQALAAPIPRPPVDDNTVVERDELFTFVGNKKQNVRRHPSPPRNALFHGLASRH
ncbi:MAG: hypothetical protein RMN25_11655 [Anaerolineae bacterium]|nr:hypothetical protein [Thermoflexales bacterium]MDW8408424.1 hypothetical protein [Anaerolineae bacterium]